MWTGRDKAQLRRVLCEEDWKWWISDVERRHQKGVSYVLNDMRLFGTHKSIILCRTVRKLQSFLGLFSQVQILNFIVCTSVIPNLTQIEGKMQEIRIEIPSLPLVLWVSFRSFHSTHTLSINFKGIYLT